MEDETSRRVGEEKSDKPREVCYEDYAFVEVRRCRSTRTREKRGKGETEPQQGAEMGSTLRALINERTRPKVMAVKKKGNRDTF